MEIKNYLLVKGIQPHLKGFYFLDKAINICLEDNSKMYHMGNLYEEIADECGANYAQVERDIRVALRRSNTKSTNSKFIARATIDILKEKNK